MNLRPVARKLIFAYNTQLVYKNVQLHTTEAHFSKAGGLNVKFKWNFPKVCLQAWKYIFQKSCLDQQKFLSVKFWNKQTFRNRSLDPTNLGSLSLICEACKYSNPSPPCSPKTLATVVPQTNLPSSNYQTRHSSEANSRLCFLHHNRQSRPLTSHLKSKFKSCCTTVERNLNGS